MRIIKLFIILFFAAPLAAQTLSDALNGNTMLKVDTQTEQITTEQMGNTTPLSSFGETEQVQAITVSRLPDIKLNEEVLTKTIFTYQVPNEIKDGNKLFLEGKQTQALENLSSLQNARAQAEAALIYLQKSDYKNAQIAISKSLKEEPQNPLYNLLQVWLYAAQGDTKKAKKTYDNMLFLTADFEYLASGKLALAQAYFNKGKFKEAGIIVQDIYSNDPYKISHAVYLIARIYFKNGNFV